ncbi:MULTISPECIES: JmjC domain-containing protein [Acinetobacter]|uniref:JmjC domain-containing protein n=1 Tax=Acinetobacter TaxID=469 RepID=UPI000708230C|nr:MULTISPECIES: cupin domain-containing protein [Acinetobacter]KQE39047.1 cupin [Acinetobacter nosocomialis]MBS5992116.1 cupin-like domain-containing protein [Acinetobacter baumannii]MCT9515229.1 cupin domain-containing protein [Acinetobacter baumannii]MDG9795207.1 cupin domain-containing protein [Acinetobacter baumannii]MDH0809395.1 cupin domain-containing protein [Acinetobacter ursingii]
MLLNFSLDKETFKNDYLYQKPFLFKSAIDSTNFSWKEVNELYSRGDISHRDFKLMNGYEVSKKEYVESYDFLGVTEYRCITSVLYEYLRNGATLVRNRIKNEPFVDQISKQIGSFAEARTLTGSYAAFSSKSSYKSHWDTRDVYAVQLLGRKRWILRKPNFEFPLYMQQTKNFPDIKEPEEIYMDVILEAGDILYIPRGWWHDPLPLDEETFHLAVATFAPTGFEYMRWLQNVMPGILDCRKNFTHFENDAEMINSISQQVMEIIKDKNCYQSFMTHHLAEQSVTSMLSLDVLGNGKVSQLNRNQKLYLNANLLHYFDEGFVIVNGNKINVDGTSLSLIQYLFNHPYSRVEDILSNFIEHPPEKINKLLFQLSVENVIELVM